MKINMHIYDRLMRLIVASAIGILYFTNVIVGALGLMLLVVAVILVFTCLTGFCPLYSALGMGTVKTKK